MKSQTFLLNILYNRGNCFDNVTKFFKTDDGSNYNRLYNLSFKKDSLNKIILKELNTKNFLGCKIPSYLSSLSANKIALWYCFWLSKYKYELNEFIELKNKFENQFLSKKYKRALETLDEIKNKFGVSLWLIDSYSILEAFSNSSKHHIELFDRVSQEFYNIFNIKNSIHERNTLFRKRMLQTLNKSGLDANLKTYYEYKLFITIPKSQEEWKSILYVEGAFSIIDIFLTVVDYFQHIRSISDSDNFPFISDCYELLRGFTSPTLQIISSLHDEQPIKCNDSIEQLLSLMKSEKYDKIIELFFSEDFTSYDSFNVYKITALSYILSNIPPEKTNDVICNRIIKDIYYILGKKDSFIESINDLSTLSRILKSFSIHKGMCIFLSLITNDISYSLDEQCYSLADIELLNFEIYSNHYSLIPFKSLYAKIDSELIDLLEHKAYEYVGANYYAQNYFKEAYIRTKTQALSDDGKILEATYLFVQAYIENVALVYIVNTKAIRDEIERKLQSYETVPLGLEETCYVFMDSYFEKDQRNCFLNFLDENNFNEPMDIVHSPLYSSELVYYFLDVVCSTNMLSWIYWLNTSNDAVIDQRIELCNYLINNNYANKKDLEAEVEELMKNKTIKQRLQHVDKSRISIDIETFKKNTFEYIDELVNLYNHTDWQLYKVESLPELTFYIDPGRDILLQIYYYYSKEFCFSNNGIDASLSTRVRHGTLSNQIIRVFLDNLLNCDGHGNNVFFDTQIQSGNADYSVKQSLLDFTSNIKNILHHLTQHTLKVYIDEPIDGAIFNYNLNVQEKEELFHSILSLKQITTINVFYVLNKFIINKTNTFLQHIRESVLPRLKEDLIKEIDSFSKNIRPNINSSIVLKEIESKIANCKTMLQSEFNTITNWFYITEIENWENFSMDDLIDICLEINKKLFSGFDSINIKKSVNNKTMFSGNIFRNCIDIILILFNNAILHSGYKNNTSNLSIDFSVSDDLNTIYFAIENNLAESVNLEEIKTKIEQLNKDYDQKKYLKINTRQEGGMGLYKVMAIMFSIFHENNLFYASLNDNKFRIELKFIKEVVCSEGSFNC